MRSLVAILVVTCSLVPAARAQRAAGRQPQPPPVPLVYLDQLEQRLDAWRQAVPVVSSTAEEAARRLVAGGHLYVAGPQQSFVNEAVGRAGGLMLTQAYQPDTKLTDQDVVLAAAATPDVPGEWAALQRAAGDAGALLVLFHDGPANGPDRAATHWLPGQAAPLPGDARAGLTSISNVVGLWAWTGELIAACVRAGKMPCVYESIWLPGGRDRDAALQGAPFHARTDVRARDSRGLGSRYLDETGSAIRRMRAVDFRELPRAAALLGRPAGGKVLILALAHMFPAEMQNGPVPAGFTAAEEGARPAEGDAVLYLGYQWFPWKEMATIGPAGRPCVVTSSRRALPEFTADRQHVYLDPCWPITDGVVDIPGYDVPALPLSGVMQGALYWQIVDLVGKRP